MLGKLLKNDLKKNMRWLWIIFASAIVLAGITRGCAELGKNIGFFKILSIFFDTIFYSLIANAIIQPFIRGFINFTKSLYGNEAYLTHTLPVTKNQIINSKFLTAIIEVILAFACVVGSILIRFASADATLTLKLILSTMISGNFSVWLVISLFVVLVIVEFLMFISIIYFSIILAHKSQDKKILKSFLYTVLMAYISISILSVFMVIVLAINKISLTSTTIILSNTAFLSIVITGIVVYSTISTIFYFLAKREFNKGVNVD